MVLVTVGKNWKGENCTFYIHGLLKENLDKVKEVVNKKDFDYLAIIAGLPGMGKSNFAITCAKYCDPNFTLDNVCFTPEDFIEKTSTFPKHSAIILDESFAPLNNKVSLTREYLKIINHLQIIRQRNLFIFICLPNFFDLSKSVSIYRSHHLYVVYGEEYGTRGKFAAFDRDKKKDLFILGYKFMNYLAVNPNFRGDFAAQKVVDEEEYTNLKISHLKQQPEGDNKGAIKVRRQRDLLIGYMRFVLKLKHEEVCNIGEMAKDTVTAAARNAKDKLKAKGFIT